MKGLEIAQLADAYIADLQAENVKTRARILLLGTVLLFERNRRSQRNIFITVTGRELMLRRFRTRPTGQLRLARRRDRGLRRRPDGRAGARTVQHVAGRTCLPSSWISGNEGDYLERCIPFSMSGERLIVTQNRRLRSCC